jgi:hypothetical protein
MCRCLAYGAQEMTQETMPRKRKGSGLSVIRKKHAKKETIPSLPPAAEELLLPVDHDGADDKEHLPDEDLFLDNDTRTINMQATTRSDNGTTLNDDQEHLPDDDYLQATTSDKNCTTLNAQARRLAIAYYYVHVLGAPPPEDWDGRDGTVSHLRKALKIPTNSSGRVREIISQVHHCHCAGTRYTGARNSEGKLGRPKGSN